MNTGKSKILLIIVISLILITGGVILFSVLNGTVSAVVAVDPTDETMKSADTLLQSGNYLQALTEYDKIDETSKKNYPKAQQQIIICKDSQYKIDMEKAEALYKQGKFEEACKTAHAIVIYHSITDEYTNKMKIYEKGLLDDSLKKINALISQKKYDEALKGVDDTLYNLSGNSTLLSKKTEITKLKEDAVKEAQAAKENRKKELLAKTTHVYDDMDESTTVVPKGYSTRYINIDRSINVEPRMILSKDGTTAVINFVFGFEQDDWIFFENIKINVDGEVTEWDVSYGDRQTQVMNGGVAEWTVKVDGINTDLLPTMEKIANSKTAKIRFSGSGYRDHTVTKAEKANIKLLLELYNCYTNYNNLLSGS